MDKDTYKDIDEALVPFHEHLGAMLEIEGEALDEEKGIRMRIDEVGIESPVQLDIVINESGDITLGSSPPLYYLETGLMPVFHRVTIRAVAEQSELLNEQAYES